MPPPAMNGAASMSNGHTQYPPPQLSAQSQLQDQDQSQLDHQNGAQHISAGTLLDFMSHVSESNAYPLGSDEIALYDRQIRLWGVKAQEKYEALSVDSTIACLIMSKASDCQGPVNFYESSCKRNRQESSACWHRFLDNTGQSSSDRR